ncbi:hypothetical protein ACFLQ3_00745 [Bacteroidota bacterium]
MSTYGFLPVILISLFVYTISYLLTKTKYLKFPTHRRVWNLLLLVSFMVAGIIGLFMAFIYSFEFDFEIPYIILQIHVGFGMVWFVIAFFHFVWHLTYFKKAIKALFSK